MGERAAVAGDAGLEARWAEVEARMEASAGWLAAQGSLAAKTANGRRVWVLRFVAGEGGRRVHKSIYVGNDDRPELLRRARRLLDRYRERRRWPEQLAAYVRLARAAGGIARRLPSGRAQAGRTAGGRAGP